MSKTRAQIQKDYRDRRKAAGLKELKRYVPPELHERVHRYIDRLIRQSQR